MTAADFRRIALSIDGAEEGSHMGTVDFRVGGHIFATLASVDKGFGNLGGWGRMGATHIRLAKADRNVMTGALHTAWKVRVDENTASRVEETRAARPLT